MDTRIDFLQSLQTDMALNILMCLDDPAVLVRASAVSRFWHNFVIAHGLSKQLCLRKFPLLPSVVSVVKPSCTSSDVGSSDTAEWGIHKRDHNVYASLLQAINKSIVTPTDCLLKAISASSTDNYPDESIVNTLNPRVRFINRPSYWSSKGQSNPAVPETLVYKLKANLCVVTEIKLQPFEAYFQSGNPIYSAKAVRFRLGYPKSPSEIERDLLDVPLQQPADDKFIWGYSSPEFPMAQENHLQHFKLPEPALCIGGYLQVELLGRVQRQEMDGLFYICVAHVQVKGRPLSPTFDLEILEPSGQFLLKYNLDAHRSTMQSASNDEDGEEIRVLSPEEVLWGRVGLLEYLMGGNQPIEWDDDDDGNELDEMLVL